MYSLLVFGRSACHYKVCSPVLSPGQEWKADRLRERDTAAMWVEQIRVRPSVCQRTIFSIYFIHYKGSGAGFYVLTSS